MHAPEKSIQKYMKMYEGGWEKLRNERYQRMLQMGIIEKERWPLPTRESWVQDWDTIDHKPWRIRNQAIYALMVDHMDQRQSVILLKLSREQSSSKTL